MPANPAGEWQELKIKNVSEPTSLDPVAKSKALIKIPDIISDLFDGLVSVFLRQVKSSRAGGEMENKDNTKSGRFICARALQTMEPPSPRGRYCLELAAAGRPERAASPYASYPSKVCVSSLGTDIARQAPGSRTGVRSQ